MKPVKLNGRVKGIIYERRRGTNSGISSSNSLKLDSPITSSVFAKGMKE